MVGIQAFDVPIDSPCGRIAVTAAVDFDFREVAVGYVDAVVAGSAVDLLQINPVDPQIAAAAGAAGRATGINAMCRRVFDGSFRAGGGVRDLNIFGAEEIDAILGRSIHHVILQTDRFSLGSHADAVCFGTGHRVAFDRDIGRFVAGISGDHEAVVAGIVDLVAIGDRIVVHRDIADGFSAIGRLSDNINARMLGIAHSVGGDGAIGTAHHGNAAGIPGVHDGVVVDADIVGMRGLAGVRNHRDGVIARSLDIITFDQDKLGTLRHMDAVRQGITDPVARDPCPTAAGRSSRTPDENARSLRLGDGHIADLKTRVGVFYPDGGAQLSFTLTGLTDEWAGKRRLDFAVLEFGVGSLKDDGSVRGG